MSAPALEDFLAAALHHERAARRLSPVLCSDLVIANVYHRRIAEFVGEFLDEHDTLPRPGDWETWISDRPEGEREGIREALRNLRRRDLSAWTLDFLIPSAQERFRQEAADNLRARINRTEEASRPDALIAAARELEELTRATAGDWPDPAPLGPPPPDPLPLAALPEWLRDFVASMTEAIQVPSDLPFLLSLSALSTAVANKARIIVRPGHTEPVHVWTAVVLPPGARKSPVFKKLMAPLFSYEADQIRETKPKRERAQDKKDVVEGLLRDAKKMAKNAEDKGGIQEAFEEMEQRRDELEEIEVPPVPRLIASDVTSEALAKLMSENAGRIAVLSPEGDIFKILAGRYRQGQVIFDHYKRGWTGDEPIRDDRMAREGSSVRRPALTVGLTLQPAILALLKNREAFRGEGLLGRFLYAVPDAGIGRRKTGAEVPPLDGAARARYAGHVRWMLDAKPAEVDDDGEYEPHEMNLSAGAREALFAFEGEVETALTPGGDLRPIADWATKLPGQVTRIAGLLTLAARAGNREPLWSDPIPARRMEDAVRIGRRLIPHARQALLNLVEVDPDLRLGRYVLEKLRQIPEGSRTTIRDLHQVVQGKRGLGEVKPLERILGRLAEHDLVRVIERPSTGPGRPPSPYVELNPKARESIVEIVQNRGGSHLDDLDERSPGVEGEDEDGLDDLDEPDEAIPEQDQNEGSPPDDPIRTLEKLARDPDLPDRLRRRISQAFPSPSEAEARELIADIRDYLSGEGN